MRPTWGQRQRGAFARALLFALALAPTRDAPDALTEDAPVADKADGDTFAAQVSRPAAVIRTRESRARASVTAGRAVFAEGATEDDVLAPPWLYTGGSMNTRSKLLLGAILLAVAGGGYMLRGLRSPGGRYAEFSSPDGLLRVVVTREASWGGVAPGQGGDAPGVAELVDETGRVLQRAALSSVNQVQDVTWDGAEVRFTPFIHWALPPRSYSVDGEHAP
jgi:hypothetical protein